MFWPLVLHLGSELPKDLGDPLSQAWQLAWGGHALVHQPLDFFQSNQFWPGKDTLALSDALVGYAPLAVPGEGVKAAVARYDVVFLLATRWRSRAPSCSHVSWGSARRLRASRARRSPTRRGAWSRAATCTSCPAARSRWRSRS